MSAASTEPDSGYARLESQINWYDRKSGEAQAFYKRIRYAQLLTTAVVPVLAIFDLRWITAAFAGLVLVAEAVQQLNQWQNNWITYRSTCEALRHEKYTYLGGAGVYSGLSADDAKKTLVERVEALVSTEHAKWISRQEYDERAAKSETK